MESLEVIINNETFRIIQNTADGQTFSVFNHATCHIVKKNDFGIWKAIEHRFGTDNLPLEAIGDAIDKHYSKWPVITNEIPSSANPLNG